ncbi:MAG: hypothetical protein ABR505_05345, partial [Actinomycetota bacterium]
MSKKLLGLCTVVALVAALLGANTLPAAANHTGDGPPPASFLPDDDATGTVTGALGTVLSDRSDGTDNAAHLTAVALPAAERVQWRACPTSVTPPVDNTELGQCNIILGTDTTAKTPGQATLFGTPDEAYDIKFNVPANMDADVNTATPQFDVLVLQCAGTGESLPPAANATCSSDLEEAIVFDDAESGEPDTSSGEMISICTADSASLGGPESSTAGTVATATAEDPCEANPSGFTTLTDAQKAEVAARFRPWEHGDPVPNDGFVLRVTTSPDLVTGSTDAEAGAEAALLACRDLGGGGTGQGAFSPSANQEPEECDDPADSEVGLGNEGVGGNNDFGNCEVIQSLATHTLWECAFADDTTEDDNVTQAVSISTNVFFTGEGSGFCDFFGSDCLLDSHFTVSGVRTAANVTASFTPTFQENGSPSSSAGCEAGETPDTTEDNAVASAGNPEEVEFCFIDQFGNRLGGFQVTIESTGPQGSGLENCPGTSHDHNNDGRNDHCHATTDSAGKLTLVVDNQTQSGLIARPGAQTATGCGDPQFTAGGTPQTIPAQPAGHGCGDVTATNLKASVTKNWLSRPQHIHLVFQGTGSASDPCHSGDTFRENVIGDRDTIVACVMDGAENPATTSQVGPTGVNPGWRLQWTTAPVGGGELTATRFSSIPPSQTGTDGRAIAELESFRQGNDNVCVTLINSASGIAVGNPACVNKRVTQVTQPTSTQSPTGTATATQTGSPGPGQRTVTLEASKNRKTFGKEVTLTATVSGTSPTVPAACIAGVEVTLSRTIAGTTQVVQVATGTTNGEGVVSFVRNA